MEPSASVQSIPVSLPAENDRPLSAGGVPGHPSATAKADPYASVRNMVLPVLIFGMVEVRRLKREIQTLDEYMRQAAIREAGWQPALPRLSRLCEALATENHLNLLQPADRQQLRTFLTGVEHTAPTIHISFASDPSSAFTAKVVTWLRANIHPHTLLQTGLQPTIAAGCILRTDNHVFDFSLRERFTETQPLLLQAFDTEAPAPVAVPAAEAATPAVVAAPAEAAPAPEPIPTAQPSASAAPQEIKA